MFNDGENIMVNSGRCPKCETILRSVVIEPVEVKVGFESKYHGISFCCPSCRNVLSVEIDPIALMSDTIAGVVEKLRGPSF